MADSGRNGSIQSCTGSASQTQVHHGAVFDSVRIDVADDPFKRLNDVTSLRKPRYITEHLDGYDACSLGHPVSPASDCARDMSAMALHVLIACTAVGHEYGPLGSPSLKFDMLIVDASVDDVRHCASAGCVVPVCVTVRGVANFGACRNPSQTPRCVRLKLAVAVELLWLDAKNLECGGKRSQQHDEIIWQRTGMWFSYSHTSGIFSNSALVASSNLAE